MGLIIEPKGIDFIIQSEPLTLEEQAQLSAFISARRAILKKKKSKAKTAEKKKNIQPAIAQQGLD